VDLNSVNRHSIRMTDSGNLYPKREGIFSDSFEEIFNEES